MDSSEIYREDVFDWSSVEKDNNHLPAFTNEEESEEETESETEEERKETVKHSQTDVPLTQAEEAPRTCSATQDEDAVGSQVKRTGTGRLRLFKCEFCCAEIRRSAYSRLQHYHEMHFDKLKERNIYCQVCGRYFSDLRSSHIHTSRHCDLANIILDAGPKNGPREYIEFFKMVNNDPELRSKMLETRHEYVTRPFIVKFATMDKAMLLSCVPIVERRRRRNLFVDMTGLRQMRIDYYFPKKIRTVSDERGESSSSGQPP